MAGNRLAVRAVGEGPYELVLRCEGAGEQRFAASTLKTLARDIGRFAPFTTHRRADMPGVVLVDAVALGVVRHGSSLAVEAFVEPIPPERAAHERALARAGELLRDTSRCPCAARRRLPGSGARHPSNGRRSRSSSHHRLVVARELGIGELSAQVRTAMGVLARVVGIGRG